MKPIRTIRKLLTEIELEASAKFPAKPKYDYIDNWIIGIEKELDNLKEHFNKDKLGNSKGD